MVNSCTVYVESKTLLTVLALCGYLNSDQYIIYKHRITRVITQLCNVRQRLTWPSMFARADKSPAFSAKWAARHPSLYIYCVGHMRFNPSVDCCLWRTTQQLKFVQLIRELQFRKDHQSRLPQPPSWNLGLWHVSSFDWGHGLKGEVIWPQQLRWW